MWRRPFNTGTTLLYLIILSAFFGAFLFYPLLYIFPHAFYIDGKLSFTFFKLMVANPIYRDAVVNSINIGVITTIVTTIISLPLAYLMVRYKFAGKELLKGLLLIPMVMPPFVGAIGMRQFFARFGSVNLLLMKLGIVHQPIDWLGGGGLWGVIIMEALHLYPIMYLNIVAALANIDPSLEEAAENTGANKWKVFTTVTLPLIMPGYIGGAAIVFIWAFTDLGTPLIFECRDVIPVQIFNMVTDIGGNPMGYALVVFVILVTMVFFYLSRKILGRKSYEMLPRQSSELRVESSAFRVGLIYAFTLGIILVALLPHLSVFLTSISQKWFMTIMPENITMTYYGKVFTHDLTLPGIRNSIVFSFFSTIIDIILGILIAYLLTRKDIPAKGILDTASMLPLALPGLVLAFGYVGCFSSTRIDPRQDPSFLLVIAYAVRRLPYTVRTAYAGFQQTSVYLEEASHSLGASPLYTLRKITLPLIRPHLIAGGILAFAFAMLEVSDSLILAMKEKFYPITKVIYVLNGRVTDGPYIASAMGILGMLLLTASLIIAGRYLGKRMGELFK